MRDIDIRVPVNDREKRQAERLAAREGRTVAGLVRYILDRLASGKAVVLDGLTKAEQDAIAKEVID